MQKLQPLFVIKFPLTKHIPQQSYEKISSLHKTTKSISKCQLKSPLRKI